MFGIGMGEFILILIVGLIIFGPKNLPEVGKTLGKGLREFRKAQAALSATLEESANETPKNSAEEVKPAEKKSATVDDVINAANENPVPKEIYTGTKTEGAEKVSATVDNSINAANENPIPKEIYTGTKTDGAEKVSVEKEPARATVDDVINAANENPIPKEIYTGTKTDGAEKISVEKKSATVDNSINAANENSAFKEEKRN